MGQTKGEGAGKRPSKAERELLSFILSMKAPWKNNAIQYLYSTFNSFIVKSHDTPGEQVHIGLPLSLGVDYGHRACMCLPETLGHPLTCQTGRIGRPLSMGSNRLGGSAVSCMDHAPNFHDSQCEKQVLGSLYCPMEHLPPNTR